MANVLTAVINRAEDVFNYNGWFSRGGLVVQHLRWLPEGNNRKMTVPEEWDHTHADV